MSSDIISRLKAGIQCRKETIWPGSDVRIHIRVLTEADYQSAAMATDNHYKNCRVDLSNIEERNAYLHTRLLHAALVDHDGKPLIAQFGDFSELLTPSTRDILVGELNGWQEENSPRFEEMSDDEFSNLYESVKKNPERAWSVSGINTLRRLAVTLASPQLLPPTDNSCS